MGQEDFAWKHAHPSWYPKLKVARVNRDKKLAGIWAPPSGTRVVDVFGDEGVVVKEYRGGGVLLQMDNGEREGVLPRSITPVDEVRPQSRPKASPNTGETGSTIHEDPTGHYYVMVRHGDSDYPKKITNFVMALRHVIFVDGDDARRIFGVEIRGRDYQLPSHLFSNPNKFTATLNAWGLEWDGSPRDLRGLYSMLNATEAPTMIGTDVVGLHGSSFVLPDEIVGQRGVWAYVPPEAAPSLWKGKTALSVGTWDAEAVETLARLHRAEVMTPLLGWVAASPLRSLCKNFPPAVVAGGSGFGKTTLLEMVLSVFGFWTKAATNVTTTTPHAVQSFGASSNALPVWLDEFRPGGREETVRTVEQMIRDSWDGSGSKKAGWQGASMEVREIPACAPLIISGEDATFTETSQVERAIIIDLPATGRNRPALDALLATVEKDGREIDHRGFGRAYLEWILANQAEPWMTPPNLTDRPEQGRAVVKWGYMLLRTFLRETTGEEHLPDFDDSLIKAYQQEESKVDQYLEAVQYASDNEVCGFDGKLLAWQDDGTRWVRSNRALHAWAIKSGFKLPGGPKALTSLAKTKYGAKQDDRRRFYWLIAKETPTLPTEE